MILSNHWTLDLSYENSCRQEASKWKWLCLNKTLLIKIGETSFMSFCLNKFKIPGTKDIYTSQSDRKAIHENPKL